MLPVVVICAVALVIVAIRGEPVPVRDVVLFGLVVFPIMCFVLFLFFALVEVLDFWMLSPYFERQWQHRRNLAKDPFLAEQRCKVSATEEVWVRHISMTDTTNARPMPALEVLHSKDGGHTWETLPLRLSPSARFACIFTAKWPPSPGSRKLACNNGSVSFETLGKGFERLQFIDAYDVLWLPVWRATYDPHREWWTLKFVGPIDWSDFHWAK